MSKFDLRRIWPAGAAILAIVLLAFIPIAPVRIVARYILVAYLPGLAIWKRVRTHRHVSVTAVSTAPVMFPFMKTAICGR